MQVIEKSYSNEYKIGKLNAIKRFCKHRDNEKDFLYEINLGSMNIYLLPNLAEIVFLKEYTGGSGGHDIEFETITEDQQKFYEIIHFEKVKAFIKLANELQKITI